MTGISLSGENCPECGNSQCTRITRQWWMRWIPMARSFVCDKCEAEFLLVGRNLKFLTRKAEE